MDDDWLPRGTLRYPEYLGLARLLDLQHPVSRPAHHDELLFITVHQVFELWFKLELHELDAAVRAMRGDDVRGAMEVFLLVFCSTLPVVVPFLLFDAVPRAMRTSNAVAVVMLCVGGYSLGRYSGLRPWATAAAMTGLGLFLVAVDLPWMEPHCD